MKNERKKYEFAYNKIHLIYTIIKKISKKSDGQLVASALKNADDFIFIIKKYEQQLFAYIKRLMNIRNEDAEDILQEVFIKIYENLNDFDRDLKFSSWIYRITYNHTISYYRKNKTKMQTLSIGDNEVLIEKLKSELNLKEEIDKKILKEKVQKFLEGMTMIKEIYVPKKIINFVAKPS